MKHEPNTKEIIEGLQKDTWSHSIEEPAIRVSNCCKKPVVILGAEVEPFYVCTDCSHTCTPIEEPTEGKTLKHLVTGKVIGTYTENCKCKNPYCEHLVTDYDKFLEEPTEEKCGCRLDYRDKNCKTHTPHIVVDYSPSPKDTCEEWEKQDYSIIQNDGTYYTGKLALEDIVSLRSLLAQKEATAREEEWGAIKFEIKKLYRQKRFYPNAHMSCHGGSPNVDKMCVACKEVYRYNEGIKDAERLLLALKTN